jgi:hypothetical protein
MICASVYLLVFIRNLLVHLAEKILLIQPLNFGGDYLVIDLLLGLGVKRALDQSVPNWRQLRPPSSEVRISPSCVAAKARSGLTGSAA